MLDERAGDLHRVVGAQAAGNQSVAETRTVIGRSSGHAARTASNTSSGYRSRFASDPPYRSVRRLVSGDRKEDSR